MHSCSSGCVEASRPYARPPHVSNAKGKKEKEHCSFRSSFGVEMRPVCGLISCMVICCCTSQALRICDWCTEWVDTSHDCSQQWAHGCCWVPAAEWCQREPPRKGTQSSSMYMRLQCCGCGCGGEWLVCLWWWALKGAAVGCEPSENSNQVLVFIFALFPNLNVSVHTDWGVFHPCVHPFVGAGAMRCAPWWNYPGSLKTQRRLCGPQVHWSNTKSNTLQFHLTCRYLMAQSNGLCRAFHLSNFLYSASSNFQAW